RHAAGEFPNLHEAQVGVAREYGQPSWAALKQLISGEPEGDGAALTQLRWLINRFRGGDAPGWSAPGLDELRAHMSDSVLAEIPAADRLASMIRGTSRLREEPVASPQTAWSAPAQVADLMVEARVEDEPPYRLTRVRAVPAVRGTTDARVAVPAPPRVRGPMPA